MLTLNETTQRRQGQRPLVRLMLYEREVFRLPALCRELTIVAGRAWVTVGARDLILDQGETLALSAEADGVLISPLGSAPLVAEAWS